MENYPGTWSLFSIQFKPEQLPKSTDLAAAQRLMDRMSHERLGGAPVEVVEFIARTRTSHNPINAIVDLCLYRIELSVEPALNPRYYVDAAWMTAQEYMSRRTNKSCGTCMRMWSDYCYKSGLSSTRFAPPVITNDDLDFLR